MFHTNLLPINNSVPLCYSIQYNTFFPDTSFFVYFLRFFSYFEWTVSIYFYLLKFMYLLMISGNVGSGGIATFSVLYVL